MKRLVLFIPILALAQGDALFDGVAPADEPPVPAPFSEWDGVTQLHPDPHAESAAFPSLFLVGEFELEKDAPEGLSGIAWTSNPGYPEYAGPAFSLREESFDVCGPDSYALCEDSGGWIHYAEIGVDRGSGAVTSAVFRARERLTGADGSSDLEGIAFARSRRNTTHCQLYVSDEHHRCIARDRPLAFSTPSSVVAISLPEPLRAHRPNKGVEAMCLSPDDRALWLANEDALPEDGPVATAERGALVRLWRMDAMPDAVKIRPEANLPTRWWYYPLDPAAGSPFPHLPDPFNGLAALCALPDGRLLALERTYGLRTRSADDPRASLIAVSIYLVDPLSSAARTAAAERPPVLAKTLLWRGLTGRANYEGMTLGPELADGSRALILVSDGDVTRKGAFAFPWSKRLLAFRLRLPGDYFASPTCCATSDSPQ